VKLNKTEIKSLSKRSSSNLISPLSTRSKLFRLRDSIKNDDSEDLENSLQNTKIILNLQTL